MKKEKVVGGGAGGAERRVERVEERMAWLERHVTEQDKVILGMRKEMDGLRAELGALRLLMRDQGEGMGRLGEDERPPHY